MAAINLTDSQLQFSRVCYSSCLLERLITIFLFRLLRYPQKIGSNNDTYLHREWNRLRYDAEILGLDNVTLQQLGEDTFNMDFPTIKPENLEPVYVGCEDRAARSADRIRQLTDKIYEDFEPTHAVVVEALGRITDPSSLTPKQERLLAFLEQEYNL